MASTVVALVRQEASGIAIVKGLQIIGPVGVQYPLQQM